MQKIPCMSGLHYLKDFLFARGIDFDIILIWQVFQKRLPPEAVDLVCRFFQYSPNLRCTAVSLTSHFLYLYSILVLYVQLLLKNYLMLAILWLQLEACIHPFFDELRDPNTRLPNGRPLPPLFNFKPQGESKCYDRLRDEQNLKLKFSPCLVGIMVSWAKSWHRDFAEHTAVPNKLLKTNLFKAVNH